MGDDSSPSLDKLRANWTPSQDQYFLELLLSHVHKGNKTGKVFSRQAWVDMIEQFNTKFGFKYDVEVLKNRHKRFRKQYTEMKMIVGQKGFQWDGTLNMIIADDKAWDECIKVHPNAQPFRKRVLPYYNDMCIIFGHSVADGRYSLSCYDVDFEYEEQDLNDKIITSEGVDDQTPPAVIKQGRVEWSPMMDQFFVELMVEQVVLRNRFNVLRRHYCSINVLLGKEGFSWDKTQHKVVADEQVWQKCIKVHHNFRLYKIKSMPFYSGMCIVCRNEVTTGCKSNLEREASGGNLSVPDTQPLPNAGASNLEKETSGVNDSLSDTQTLTNADNGALHIGEKNSSRETKALANTDNISLQHVGKNVSRHLKRHKPKMPPTLNEFKKAREHIAVAFTSLNKKAKKEDNFSVDNVIKVLQAIPDLDDDLILDACDFLEDETRARMFLALAAPLRKKWLLRKLRSQ